MSAKAKTPAKPKPAQPKKAADKASDISSSTVSNSEPQKKKVRGRPFVKGDPRINRKGAPKGWEDARKLILKMLNEQVTSPDGKVSKTRLELILMDFITSRDFRKQKETLSIAGLLPKEMGAGVPFMNIDLRTLTDGQLRRLAAGEDIFAVLLHPD